MMGGGTCPEDKVLRHLRDGHDCWDGSCDADECCEDPRSCNDVPAGVNGAEYGYIPSEQSEVEFQQSWARATPVCAPGGSLGLSLAMGTGGRRDGFTRPDGNDEL